jgi:hypothetical protein
MVSYLTSSMASATYQTIAGMSSYLTTAAADSNITTRLENYVDKSSPQTVGGNKTFSGSTIFNTVAPTSNLGYLTNISYDNYFNLTEYSIGYSNIVTNTIQKLKHGQNNIIAEFGQLKRGVFLINWSLDIYNTVTGSGYKTLYKLYTQVGTSTTLPSSSGQLTLINTTTRVPGSIFSETYFDNFYRITNGETSTFSNSFIYTNTTLNATLYQIVYILTVDKNGTTLESVFQGTGTIQVTRIS